MCVFYSIKPKQPLATYVNMHAHSILCTISCYYCLRTPGIYQVLMLSCNGSKLEGNERSIRDHHKVMNLSPKHRISWPFALDSNNKELGLHQADNILRAKQFHTVCDDGMAISLFCTGVSKLSEVETVQILITMMHVFSSMPPTRQTMSARQKKKAGNFLLAPSWSSAGGFATPLVVFSFSKLPFVKRGNWSTDRLRNWETCVGLWLTLAAVLCDKSPWLSGWLVDIGQCNCAAMNSLRKWQKSRRVFLQSVFRHSLSCKF